MKPLDRMFEQVELFVRQGPLEAECLAPAIEFYTRAFDAKELFRIGEPGMIGHCEMKIGIAIFMLADEHQENGAAPGIFVIRSATCGSSLHTWKTFLPKK